eukprot:189063-Alexandrium_andersonii.AAC.1
MATSASADPPTAGRLGVAASSALGSTRLRLTGSGGGFGNGPSSVTIVAWGGLGPRRPGPPVSVRGCAESTAEACSAACFAAYSRNCAA